MFMQIFNNILTILLTLSYTIVVTLAISISLYNPIEKVANAFNKTKYLKMIKITIYMIAIGVLSAFSISVITLANIKLLHLLLAHTNQIVYLIGVIPNVLIVSLLGLHLGINTTNNWWYRFNERLGTYIK